MSPNVGTPSELGQPPTERQLRGLDDRASQNQWVIDKLEKMRRTALLLIRNVDALEEADVLVLVQLRRLQAEIARLKSDYGIQAISTTAWVDNWHLGLSAAAA